MFWVDGSDQVRSLPAAWTSEAAEDAFVALSRGRSAFRPEDLLALADLLGGLGSDVAGAVGAVGSGSGVVVGEEGAGRHEERSHGGVDVNRITPS